MTTVETLEAWAELRGRLQDLLEGQPAPLRRLARVQACVFLNWFPPGRSGEWYLSQISVYLAPRPSAPSGPIESVRMERDPTCATEDR